MNTAYQQFREAYHDSSLIIATMGNETIHYLSAASHIRKICN